MYLNVNGNICLQTKDAKVRLMLKSVKKITIVDAEFTLN